MNSGEPLRSFRHVIASLDLRDARHKPVVQVHCKDGDSCKQ